MFATSDFPSEFLTRKPANHQIHKRCASLPKTANQW